MANFFLLYSPGPGWLEGKPAAEQPLQEHGPYLIRLHSENKLSFVGQFMDRPGGVLLLDVADENEAISTAESDPAVRDSVFVYELHPAQIVVGG